MLINLFHHRYLLWVLVKRDISSKYKSSAGGLIWSVINPLAFFVLYAVIFSQVIKVKLGDVPYNFVEFLFCGLWPWLAFSEAVARSTSTVVDNGAMVTRMIFPSEILVPSLVLSGLVQQFIGFGLFFLALIALGHWPGPEGWRLVLLPVPILFQTLFTLGLGWLLAGIYVFFRDMGQIVGTALLAWFLVTPIIYPLTLVPPGFKVVAALNPFTHLVEAYRSIILGSPWPHWGGLVYFGAAALFLFWIGGQAFSRLKKDFADAV
ncbi:MAG: ABC transporter permease [Deltaproteobacteria bacterium]|nr:ABC transporter permease [Deltaproteobacteria bacterium]